MTKLVKVLFMVSVLCAALFAQNTSSTQSKTSQQQTASAAAADAAKADRFAKMKKAGQISVIGGSATFLTGVVLLGVGTAKMMDDGEGAGAWIVGSLLTPVGAMWATAGIPLCIVGGIKERQYRGQTTLYLAPNGVRLAVDF